MCEGAVDVSLNGICMDPAATARKTALRSRAEAVMTGVKAQRLRAPGIVERPPG